MYRTLLRVLPRPFRARHGEEMGRLFSEQLSEARERGWASVAWLWVRTMVDVVSRSWSLRRRAIGTRKWRETMTTWVEQIATDSRGAWRGLRRTPGFFLAAVATVAVGVGALTGVFSVVNGVVLSPLPYPDPDQLVVVYNHYPTLDVLRGAQSPGDLDDYRTQADLLSSVGSVSTFPQTLIDDGRPQRVDVALVTPGFFSMLGVEPALGRDITSDDDHDVVLVSHAYWQAQLAGRADVIGTTLPFAGAPKTVIGVLPADFRLVVPSNFGVPDRPALWTPIPAQGWGRDTGDRTAHWMNVIGRLAPAASLPELQQQMSVVAEGQRELLPTRAEREARISVIPLHDEIVRDVEPALLALLASAAVVLLIACANVANLLLVRAQRRRPELAVRCALGAGRLRVLRELVTEGAVLGFVGAAVALGIAMLGTPLFLALDSGSLPRAEDVGIDMTVLGFSLGITAAVVLLFSAGPAWLVTRRDVASEMRGAGRASLSRSGNRLSSSLIVAELALSLVLLVGGGLLVRSLVALTETDPGFDTEGLLTFQAPLPASAFQVPRPTDWPPRPYFNHVRKPYYDELTRTLLELPGVTAVGGIFPTPLSGDQSGSTYAPEGAPGDAQKNLASSQLVTPEYFETVGIRFLEGRTFLPDESGDKLVIDRTMAETLWPGESALGRRMEIGWWSGPVWGDVIGVVESVRSHSLTESNPPTVYRLGTVFAYSAMTMVLAVEGDPLTLVDQVRRAVAQLAPEAPVIDVRLMSEYVDDQTAKTRFVLALVGVFAIVALGLAAVGLYGVISYSVGQRVREYGIRLAFGAGRARVFGLVLSRGLGLTAAGVALGVPAALGVRDHVEPFLVGVEATDPMTLATIVGLVAVVALTAVTGPALRATLVDPVESLRSE